MAVAEVRVLVTTVKEQKWQLGKQGVRDQRTVSNLCTKILSDYPEQSEEGGKP